MTKPNNASQAPGEIKTKKQTRSKEVVFAELIALSKLIPELMKKKEKLRLEYLAIVDPEPN